ncbi:hypothetical protein VTK73DRAFT_7557 [Phialemonium thermophilum]|uniref:Uncharacterized protein n=1 Tax=Phialemonium thermophilum TaxID=223376 RepID=A0ABR3XS31_9PEZI
MFPGLLYEEPLNSGRRYAVSITRTVLLLTQRTAREQTRRDNPLRTGNPHTASNRCGINNEKKRRSVHVKKKRTPEDIQSVNTRWTSRLRTV